MCWCWPRTHIRQELFERGQPLCGYTNPTTSIVLVRDMLGIVAACLHHLPDSVLGLELFHDRSARFTSAMCLRVWAQKVVASNFYTCTTVTLTENPCTDILSTRPEIGQSGHYGKLSELLPYNRVGMMRKPAFLNHGVLLQGSVSPWRSYSSVVHARSLRRYHVPARKSVRHRQS